jgi:antitoxin YefM
VDLRDSLVADLEKFPPSEDLLAETYVFAHDSAMKTITASKARANLYRLIDETADSSEPVQITGRRTNAVLVSEQDWRAIQETMYLLSIPGMRESIRRGMKTPIAECAEEIDW